MKEIEKKFIMFIIGAGIGSFLMRRNFQTVTTDVIKFEQIELNRQINQKTQNNENDTFQKIDKTTENVESPYSSLYAKSDKFKI